MSNPPEKELRKSRMTIILVIVLCAAPFVAATLLYKMGWRPKGSINHGTLISPARPIQDLIFKDASGEKKTAKDLKGKWSMVYIGNMPCDKICKRSLYKMRQVRLTQGKHLERVQNIFIVTNSTAPGVSLLKEHRFLYLYPTVATKSKLYKQFRFPQGSPRDGQARVYLVDPLGNFFMFYQPDASPTGMRKDLRRLLRISKIG